MDLHMDKDGFLLAENGDRFSFGEGDNADTIKVIDVVSKDDVNKQIEERLSRQSASIKKKEGEIATLKAQVDKTPELQKLIDDGEKEVLTLKTEIERTKSESEQKYASELRKFRAQNETLQTELDEEKHSRIVDRLSTEIVNCSNGVFINPASDVVPKLMQYHQRIETMDEATGKGTGEFQDLFKMNVKDKDGKQQEIEVDVEKAVEVFANDDRHKHYLAPNPMRGTNGIKNKGKSAGDKDNMSDLDLISSGLTQRLSS